MNESLYLSAGVVAAAAILAPRLLHHHAPLLTLRDLPWLAMGALVMLLSDLAQTAPASAWSAVVDLGSFAVGASLAFTAHPGAGRARSAS